jgi:uncharacterized membrane protein YdbT with pleckstrin-like domain
MTDVYNDNEEVLWEAKSEVRTAWIWAVIFCVPLFTIPLSVLILIVAYMKKWGSQYTLTNERLTTSRGIIGKDIDDIEIYRIVDTKVTQGFFQRLFGIGNIWVDGKTETLYMKNIKNPKKRREQIRKMANKAREGKMRIGAY